MPTPEQIRAVVDSYKSAFDNKDRDAFVACFAPDATQTDPVTAPTNVGHEAIGVFWDNFASLADSFSFDLHQLHVCGEHAAMVFTITTRSDAGGGVAIDIVDTLRVNDDGRIQALTAYWDPGEIRTVD